MISQKLKQVILTELELDDWAIEDETTATSVPGWDSLSHVRVISAIEDAFGIRFQTAEVLRLKNVGQLQALIDKRKK
ncbi:MAG TPA: acyl carrier protein [Steroidobacteraceae bacterium]|nr:acyl carrier protein [Steroidobacteraceae bacterium]